MPCGDGWRKRIVEPLAKRVTVFRSPNGRSYEHATVCDGTQTVTCPALPALRVALPELFA